MCVIHRGMAYAIYSEILIIMLLKLHVTIRGLNCNPRVDVNLWKCMRMRVEMTCRQGGSHIS